MYQNFLLNTDSYKASHYCQYPEDTEYLSSYIESRGGKYDTVIFFGLQAFIKEYLLQPISKSNIEEAVPFLKAHGLPCYEAGWNYLLQEHGGFLPLRIEAVKEGSQVPAHQVLLQVVNTDPHCYWLTTYIETALLRAIWYPTTVATTSWICKKIIAHYLDKTSDDPGNLLFKLHDFGARGVSSFESAALGGMAHLVNFLGTDTLSGLLAAKQYYGESMAGFSIPAAEHSTITAWGPAFEQEAYRHILNTYAGKDRLVAVVSDSYDLFAALEHLWCDTLKDQLMHQGGTVVIRLDSGDPVEVVVQSLVLLKEKLGTTLNTKGYHVLPPYVRVIQGDGISSTMIEKILNAMEQHRLSAENIAFGMGGELLQKINRDTLGFAMKVSAIKRKNNPEWQAVHKSPRTDQQKRSKPGRLALIKEDGQWSTILAEELNGRTNCLEVVYENGLLKREQSFQEIRALSWKGYPQTD